MGQKVSDIREAVNAGDRSNFTLFELDYNKKLVREHKDVSKVIPTSIRHRDSIVGLGTSAEQHLMVDEEGEETETEEQDGKREGLEEEDAVASKVEGQAE